ncbi:MAG: hypothetical protein WC466_06230 [Candidatus Izemoplasmatales bacterium]
MNTLVSESYQKKWVKLYALALCKEILGMIMLQYTAVGEHKIKKPVWKTLLLEYRKDKQQLEEKLLKK